MSEQRCDVLIAGGGVAGCAAAVALREAGMHVILLEKRICGAGASGVNFGGVRQQGRHPAELPLAIRAHEIWQTLNQKISEDTEFEATGHIKVARSEADLEELEAYRETANSYGLKLEMLSHNHVRNEMPWLGEKVLGASFAPDDGQANPRVVGPAFARLARRLGADVREFTGVKSSVSTGDGFVTTTEDGQTIRSTFFLNTSGAFGNRIASWFGEEAPLRLMLPNMVVSEPLPYVIRHSIGACGGDVYVRQVRRGNIVFGGGEGWGDLDIWRARPKSITSAVAMSKAIEIVPGLRGRHAIRSWTGIEAETPDHIPVIGPCSTPNLFHAFGFCGHGFQLGPVIGLILSELVLRGETPSPIAPFAISRFAGWAPSSSADTVYSC